MRKLILSAALFASLSMSFSQSYTSYFSGNENDTITNPEGGICLMGGATEDDEAMKWFLDRAEGGDVLVLRASGSDGYNDYFLNELGIEINSVETIVCHDASSGSEPYIVDKINKAEAIWFAGGNQWNYIDFWRGTPVNDAINSAIKNRNIVIGGTSAGMAIQGDFYFSAENGTVTSDEALENPFNQYVTVDSTKFITNEYLQHTITDSHFNNPDRKGRLMVFLARIYHDYGTEGKAIAIDEYTAVCINSSGIARVYGGYPSFDDNAYFIQLNCENEDMSPENIVAGEPLTWNINSDALKIYNIKGTPSANNSFDLNDWETGVGGTWQNWSANQGELTVEDGEPLNCSSLNTDEIVQTNNIILYPNPVSDLVYLDFSNTKYEANKIVVLNNLGQQVLIQTCDNSQLTSMNLAHLSSGVYTLQVWNSSKNIENLRILKD